MGKGDRVNLGLTLRQGWRLTLGVPIFQAFRPVDGTG